MSDSIEIRLDGPNITPKQFLGASEAFFGLLQGVAKNTTAEERPDAWSVHVKQGSAIIALAPPAPNAETNQIIERVTRGLKSLASGVQSVPEGFTKHEINLARDLAATVDGETLLTIQIKNGDIPINISRDLQKTADAILSGEKFEAFGSIEGRIETLQGRENYPLACWVSDAIFKRLIVCHFKTKELEELAVGSFRRRVLVSGLIHYSKEGYPTSVDADYLRIFPEEHELPTVEDVQKIYQ